MEEGVGGGEGDGGQLVARLVLISQLFQLSRFSILKAIITQGAASFCFNY